MKKINFFFVIGISLTLVFFLINLLIINDYGVTWDFTYHFNAGLKQLRLPVRTDSFIMFASNPIPDIIPTGFYLIFFEKLKLFPWDSAYNLFSVIMGSLGIGILFLFISELINPTVAIISSLTLAFLPRYFGHLHNNMKDIPQATLFTLSLYLFYRYYNRPVFRNLLSVILALSLSLLTKINAVFIPVIVAFWYFLPFQIYSLKKRVKMMTVPLIFALTFMFLFWLIIWDHPVDRFIEWISTYTTSTTNMPVLYFGKIYYSGVNIPWHYPFGMLAATTPLPILIFFVIGLFILVKSMKDRNKSSWLIFFWFFIPLLRFLKPKMLVIDDIRHFMEIVFPLSVISGIGIVHTISLFKKAMRKIQYAAYYLFLIYIFYFVYLLWQIISVHPYQTSYFNEMINLSKKNSELFDIDFWTISYKTSMNWLNKNAPYGSRITVAMAPDIAKLYLRDDLKTYLNSKNLADTDSAIYSKSDYTVILNRKSFYGWYNIYPYTQNRTPIFTLKSQETPLVFIYKN